MSQLMARLMFDTELGHFLGDTRIRLLEGIERHGSITQAARHIPLSYKAAWDAIDIMNNLAEEPLVLRATGGKGGGGTRLTEYGRKLIALYRALEAEYQQTLARLETQLQAFSGGDLPHFQALLRKMTMRISARNQFVGKVIALRQGEVDFEVTLRLGSGEELVAVITRESAEQLELAIGSEAHALVKSSSVLLLTEGQVKTSARNQWWGAVSRIHPGPVNAEVQLTLASGKTITTVITRESVEALELKEGGQACAVFQASSVLLATAV